jgi:hypothetical protein
MNTLIAIIKERIEEAEAAQVHAVNHDENIFAQGRLYELKVLLLVLAARDPKKEA